MSLGRADVLPAPSVAEEDVVGGIDDVEAHRFLCNLYSSVLDPPMCQEVGKSSTGAPN